MAYRQTPVVLYRRTAGEDPLHIKLATLRHGTDVAVQLAPGVAWIEPEPLTTPGRFKGYSLNTQPENDFVRRPNAGEAGLAFVDVPGRTRPQRWVLGSVYRLAYQTLLPEGFSGTDDGHLHHTFLPTARVPLTYLENNLFYNEAICQLPWERVDGAFLIKANADVPPFEEGMDPDSYDLVLLLHQAFDLLFEPSDADLAVELQYRIIDAEFPPVIALEFDLKRQCHELLRKAGIVLKSDVALETKGQVATPPNSSPKREEKPSPCDSGQSMDQVQQTPDGNPTAESSQDPSLGQCSDIQVPLSSLDVARLVQGDEIVDFPVVEL